VTHAGDDDDAAQFARWRDGDVSAGDVLLRRHTPGIARFFRNKVDQAADVADLVSATFLALVGARDRFRGETSVRRFLFRLAHNVLYDHLRRRFREQREALDFTTVCLQDLAPRSLSSIVTRRRQTQAVVQALREVPIDDQVVLELMYLEGASGSEIADTLGLPEGTVRGRLRRGLERLRERVEAALVDGGDAPVTVETLEVWAAEIRDQIAPGGGDERR
jgi:RNA polymerase sigma factor (sigma-70 family)